MEKEDPGKSCQRDCLPQQNATMSGEGCQSTKGLVFYSLHAILPLISQYMPKVKTIF